MTKNQRFKQQQADFIAQKIRYYRLYKKLLKNIKVLRMFESKYYDKVHKFTGLKSKKQNCKFLDILGEKLKKQKEM